ncbi:MAG TPA: Gfo/Idh/MocA family oxidoreductase, partial [Spirochaetales bacterium]|nr:Gfo/Idh/MocA family oxidoreductase [Spirochaetales bacterium]
MISKSTACFGVGIRGAGQVAYQYAEAIQEDPYLTLRGISSRTEESAEKLASHFKTSGGETPRVYPSYEALLEDPQVDVVIECM